MDYSCGQANCSHVGCKFGPIQGSNKCEEYLSTLTDPGVPVLEMSTCPSEAPATLQTGTLAKVLRGVVKARETGLYGKALRKLQKGKVQWGLQSPQLSMHMGQVQAYFGEWGKAETELKQALAFQMQTHPTSEVALQLSNCLIELFHQREMYDEVMQQGEWTLMTWRDSLHSCELLRTVFFLADVYYTIEEEGQGFALVEEWTGKLPVKDDSSKCILLYIQAQKLAKAKTDKNGAIIYEEAIQLSQLLPPYAYITVYAHSSLAHHYGNIGENIGTIRTYFSHFPQTPRALDYILWTFYLTMYETNYTLREEIIQLIEAYYPRFPQSLSSVYCLVMLGDHCKIWHESEKAKELYLQANEQFSASFSHTIQYAHFLSRYIEYWPQEITSNLLREGDRYIEAYDIYLSHLPYSNGLLNCLRKLTNVENWTILECRYTQIYDIYARRFPQSRHFVKFLQAFGDFYRFRRDTRKAEEKLLEAYQVCSVHFPQSHLLVNCTLSLAQVYNREDKALIYYLEASHIAVGKNYLLSVQCLEALAQWYQQRKRWEEAIECYLHICKLYEGNYCSHWKYRNYLLHLAGAYLKAGRVDMAKEYVLQSIHIDDPNFHIDNSKVSTKGIEKLLEEWEESTRKIESCKHQVPYSSSSRNHIGNLEELGNAYHDTGRLEEAEQCYLKVFEMSISTDTYHWGGALKSLAAVYVGMGKEDTVEEYCLKAYQLEVSNGSLRRLKTFLSLATIYRELKQVEKVDRYWAKVSECLATMDFSIIPESDIYKIYEMAEFYVHLEKWDQAEQCCLYLCEISASIDRAMCAHFHLVTAHFYADIKRDTSAEEHYLQSLNKGVYRGRLKLWLELGECVEGTGRIETAEQYYVRGVFSHDFCVLNPSDILKFMREGLRRVYC